MQRRDFLSGTVFAGSAGLLLQGCYPADRAIPILVTEEEWVPGVEEYHAATCFECPGGCGLLARKVDGRLVKIEGNPGHPISRGGSCARAQALPQALYHPDRIKTPLARDGERGKGQWKPIGWDEALGQVAEKLTDLVAREATRELGFVTGALRGHRGKLVRRFLDAVGSPHHLIHEPFGDLAARAAAGITVGSREFFSYDVERARYVVVFGGGLVDGMRAPVLYSRGISRLRSAREGGRGKLVAVEPRLSLTAARADQWLPARPASDGDVALGLAHVLLSENRYDARWISQNATGFEAFRDAVLERYSPEEVGERAGVPADSLRRIAREMAAEGPAIAIAGTGAAGAEAGVGAAVAISHLNALLGSLGVPGGVHLHRDPPFAPWPALPRDPRAERARIAYESHQSLASVVPYLSRGELKLSALMVSGTNPLYSLPPSFELEGALARVPFIVSFATFLDETSSRADLILPEPTSFETLDDDQPSPGVPYPLASLSRPLLARPLYETRSMPEVLIELAARIGGGVAEAFPWSSWEESLRAAWSGLHRAARGSIVETGFEAFWAAAIERGGWWDEASPPSAFPYPDGKYRFDVTALRDLGSSRPGKSSDYPYSYLVYPSVAFGDGRSAHLPFLQELADPLSGVRWGSVVEIHPATAAAHGIRQGSLVEVRSPYGSVRAPAHLTPTLRPDVVAVAAGQGHTHYGRYAQGRGANAFRLMGPSVVASIGEAALGSDRVSIKEV